jgi:hypothetical protein
MRSSVLAVCVMLQHPDCCKRVGQLNEFDHRLR